MTTFRFNMITHKYNSDITKVDRGIIVHGCNAQGVMGSGVAKQLRAKYPQIFEDYVAHLELCKIEDVPVLGFVSYTQVSKELYIANAITQEFYGRDGKQYVDYSALLYALSRTARYATDAQLPVHLPYIIGAGLGG